MKFHCLPIKKRFFKQQDFSSLFQIFLCSFLVLIVCSSLKAQPKIYWTEYSRVMRANPDGSGRQTLINNLDNFQGLALDLDNDKIYFLNIEDASLERSNLDGSNIETVYTFPGNTPHSFRHLAVDSGNEKAYVCDSDNRDVSRVNFDGTGYEVLIDDCRISHGVTLDLNAGKMYYSCINSPTGFIASADLDGTNRDTIVPSVKATGLSLDVANSYLYYFDQTSGQSTYDIRRVNLDGTDDQLIYDSPTFAMSVRYDPEDDKLWLMLSGDRKIQKMDSDGTNVQTIVHTFSTPYDLSLDLLHAPLPVKLSYFNAEIHESNQVLLNWETASEEENLGFEIERSGDGENWRNIGFIEGQGNTILLTQYNFIDRSPELGENYYRLKQIDIDGKFEYSNIREITFNNDSDEMFSIFPNPTPEKFSVGVFNPKGKRAQVKLFSSTGQLLWVQHFKKGEMDSYWEKEFSLPQEELYFVMTQIGDKIKTKKVSVIGEY